MSSSTFVGICISLCATLSNAIGYTLQKLAHRRADEAALAASSPALAFWRYWQFPAGLGCCIAAAIFDVVSYGFAGQSTLGPIGAVTLVWVALLSWRVLREEYTRLDAASTALMLTGTAVALASSASAPAENFDLAGVLSRLSRAPVYAYVALVAALGCSAAVVVRRLSAFKPAALSARALVLDASLRPFCAGLLAGSTGLCVKAFVEVVSNAFREGTGDDFQRPQPYLFLAMLIFSLVNQLAFLNSGLARHDSNRIVPVYRELLRRRRCCCCCCCCCCWRSGRPWTARAPLYTRAPLAFLAHASSLFRRDHARLLPGSDWVDRLG